MPQIVNVNELTHLTRLSIERFWSALGMQGQSSLYGFSLIAIGDSPRNFFALGALASTEDGYNGRRVSALNSDRIEEVARVNRLSVEEFILQTERWEPFRWEHRDLCESYKNPSGFFAEPTMYVRDLEKSLHRNPNAYRNTQLPPETRTRLRVEVFASLTIAIQQFFHSALSGERTGATRFCTYLFSHDSEWLERESATFLNSKETSNRFRLERHGQSRVRSNPAVDYFREILAEYAGFESESMNELHRENVSGLTDQEPRNSRALLIGEIMRQYDLDEFGSLPLIPYEQFFTDNYDERSIAVNAVWKQLPDLRGIYAELKQIAARSEIERIYVTIQECPDADDDDDLDMWPQAESLVVIASTDLDGIQSLFSALKPDYCKEGWAYDGKENSRPVSRLAAAQRAFTIGWD